MSNSRQIEVRQFHYYLRERVIIPLTYLQHTNSDFRRPHRCSIMRERRDVLHNWITTCGLVIYRMVMHLLYNHENIHAITSTTCKCQWREAHNKTSFYQQPQGRLKQSSPTPTRRRHSPPTRNRRFDVVITHHITPHSTPCFSQLEDISGSLHERSLS